MKFIFAVSVAALLAIAGAGAQQLPAGYDVTTLSGADAPAGAVHGAVLLKIGTPRQRS